MNNSRQVLAFSGGKDSTAMALRMAELQEPFSLLFTPTGNELPELKAHFDSVVRMTGAEVILPPGPSLAGLIAEMKALPNWRQRWCTRLIKIVPCVNWLKTHPGTTLCVGLRADEEHRLGLYGEFASYRYPLREWGWGEARVRAYCKERGVRVPPRTDCAVCPYQRLGEWWRLWKQYPEEFAQGEAWEAMTGHTFRSPQRDTWPAALAGLRERFEAGDVPRGADDCDDEEEVACRVCRL